MAGTHESMTTNESRAEHVDPAALGAAGLGAAFALFGPKDLLSGVKGIAEIKPKVRRRIALACRLYPEPAHARA